MAPIALSICKYFVTSEQMPLFMHHSACNQYIPYIQHIQYFPYIQHIKYFPYIQLLQYILYIPNIQLTYNFALYNLFLLLL